MPAAPAALLSLHETVSMRRYLLEVLYRCYRAPAFRASGGEKTANHITDHHNRPLGYSYLFRDFCQTLMGGVYISTIPAGFRIRSGG
jgi:hypothetical protein